MGIFMLFTIILPEAICCCLQTCNVDVVLLGMYCMYVQAFIITSADIRPLGKPTPQGFCVVFKRRCM